MALATTTRKKKEKKQVKKNSWSQLTLYVFVYVFVRGDFSKTKTTSFLLNGSPNFRYNPDVENLKACYVIAYFHSFFSSIYFFGWNEEKRNHTFL